jgi:cold shock CspA family protein
VQLVGKILWWNDRDGFGVIEDETSREFYFDTSVVSSKSRDSIKRNQLVIFELNHGIRDCVCACKVRIASASQRKKIEGKLVKQLRLSADI